VVAWHEGLNAAPAPGTAQTSLKVSVPPLADTTRTTACARATWPLWRRSTMTRDVTLELKALRLHDMPGAWTDLVEQGGPAGLAQPSFLANASGWRWV
jgi:hypothetical protein